MVLAEPVKVGHGEGNLLVVRAESQVIQKPAVRSGAFGSDDGFGHGVAGVHQRPGLVAGAAEDHQVGLLRVLDNIGTGQEAAHAVPKENIGQIGVIRFDQIVELVHVLHHIVPAVFLGEKAQIIGIGNRLAVAQMVVAHHKDAVLGKESGKIVVPVDMLGNAVGNLQNGPGRPVRHTLPGVDMVFAGAGCKSKITETWH